MKKNNSAPQDESTNNESTNNESTNNESAQNQPEGNSPVEHESTDHESTKGESSVGPVGGESEIAETNEPLASLQSIIADQNTPAETRQKVARYLRLVEKESLETARELAGQPERNLELANELADELENDFYPRDIWNFVVNTLEIMLERNSIGFNDSDYIRAVVPILLDRCPDDEEGIRCLIKAFKKEREDRASQAAEPLNRQKAA